MITDQTTQGKNLIDLNLIAVAKITGCFGVKGKLKIQLFSKSSNVFDNIKSVKIGNTEKDSVEAEIEESEIHQKSSVIKLRGIDDKNNAEFFINRFIYVDENKISPPRDGRYFTHEILQCKMWSTDEELIGNVVDVLVTPAQDLWVVEHNGKKYYIPAVKEFIKNVDIKNNKIVIKVIEGLINE